jgi:hypothetical protein
MTGFETDHMQGLGHTASAGDAGALSNRYIHPLRIGSLALENNLCLAPMAGFTNVAFRLIAKEVGGCGLVASEMVAALGHRNAGTEKRSSRTTFGDAGLWPRSRSLRRDRACVG